MKPARDPNVDYKALVARGYDVCSPEFNAIRVRDARDVLGPLADRLAAGAHELDLGCGAGVPIARTLAQTCSVTGVDISPVQIALAREQVPAATFSVADMASCDFPAASFDAVVSFYAIFHLPRKHHEGLFRNVQRWLKPGGYFMASLASAAEEGYTEDFFGVEMYWSNFSPAEYARMLERSGFEIVEWGVLAHGYSDDELPPESHPLVLARKA
jgi:cyclopropane fatty-acyl-phospholipid synthase-like methyltransferase